MWGRNKSLFIYIYGRTIEKQEYTIHISPINPFWATVVHEPLPIGSGCSMKAEFHTWIFKSISFQKYGYGGVLYGCEQGLYGWKVTDW